MAKLYFHYSTMNAGKSTLLLQASHNYREGGMATYLITAQFDNRAGEGRIGIRARTNAPPRSRTSREGSRPRPSLPRADPRSPRQGGASRLLWW